MEPKLKKLHGFAVIGKEIRTTMDEGNNFVEIPEFWTREMKDNLFDKIPNRKSKEICLGLCMDFDCSNNTFAYLIGSEVTDKSDVPEGMVVREIPEAEYLVFTVKGKMPEAIQSAFRQIFSEWFPKSEWKHTGTPEFEYYDERYCEGGESEMDIYVPVVKK